MISRARAQLLNWMTILAHHRELSTPLVLRRKCFVGDRYEW